MPIASGRRPSFSMSPEPNTSNYRPNASLKTYYGSSTKPNISEAWQNDSADNLRESRASPPAFVRAVTHEEFRSKDKGKKRAPPNDSWYDSIPNIPSRDRSPTPQVEHPTRYTGTPSPQDPVFDRPPPVGHVRRDDGAMEPPTWSIISGPATPLFYFHDRSSSSTLPEPEVASHSDHGYDSNKQHSSNMFAGEDEQGDEEVSVGDDAFGGEGLSVGDDEFGGAEAYAGEHDTFDDIDENGRGHFVSSLSDSMYSLMFLLLVSRISQEIRRSWSTTDR